MMNGDNNMKTYNGDCIEEMRKLNDNSVDSIVTDPPYELGFMGKSWDSTGIAYNIDVWREALRVLKPGGHMLAFGGTRTYHRMACAIEDTGFEIRDQMQWLYGSGFPKSMDISKAIDKAARAKREIIGKSHSKGIRSGQNHIVGDNYECSGYPITIPATTEVKQWDGWGTALKPANEPIVVARKPLSEKTVAANVMRWGTGGINIDKGRIGTETVVSLPSRNKDCKIYAQDKWTKSEAIGKRTEHIGRFPANVLFDESAAAILDEQSNASRFFYCAKASKKERGEGNVHPTVKPLKLMEYLVTLVTPPNGVVLDPFMGSGTTGIAANSKGFNFIGIEKDEKYFNIANERIKGLKW